MRRRKEEAQGRRRKVAGACPALSAAGAWPGGPRDTTTPAFSSSILRDCELKAAAAQDSDEVLKK